MASVYLRSYPLRLRAALLLSLLHVAACQRPTPPTGPTQADVGQPDLDALWEASLAVLRRHDYQPDRQDRALGIITTFPVTSQQWGEFWRHDVADPYSLLQASLQNIKRQATVKFHRRDVDHWDIDVQVEVFRQTRPESQITSASAAVQAFSGLLPTTEGSLQLYGRAESWYSPVGRDGTMEARILDQILVRAGMDAAPIQTAAAP